MTTGSTCSKTGSVGYLFVFRYVLRSIMPVQVLLAGNHVFYIQVLYVCVYGAIGLASVLS